MEPKFEARLGINTKEFDSNLKKAESSMNGFGKGVKAVGGVLATTFSVVAITAFTKKSVELAMQLEGVKIAFQSLNAPGLLEGLRAATRNTVTDLQLMQKAVQAKNFKIPLSELATYFEFATKRAIQTGESVDYLVDSIINGIGRKSSRALDNLGISATQLQDEIKKTGDYGVAAGNIIRAELEAMGDVADTTAIKVASIKTAFENLKTGIGTRISESKVFQGALGWISNVGKFAQMPGMSLSQAIFGATFKAKEINKIIDESNKKIIENSQAIVKQKNAVEGLIRVLGPQSITGLTASVSKRVASMDMETINAFKKIYVVSNALAAAPNIAPSAEGIEKINSILLEQQEIAMSLQDTFTYLFASMQNGFKGLGQAIAQMITAWVAKLMAAAATMALLNAIPGMPALLKTLDNAVNPFKGVGNIVGGVQPVGQSIDVGGEFKIYGKDLVRTLQRNS